MIKLKLANQIAILYSTLLCAPGIPEMAHSHIILYFCLYFSNISGAVILKYVDILSKSLSYYGFKILKILWKCIKSKMEILETRRLNYEKINDFFFLGCYCPSLLVKILTILHDHSGKLIMAFWKRSLMTWMFSWLKWWLSISILLSLQASLEVIATFFFSKKIHERKH